MRVNNWKLNCSRTIEETWVRAQQGANKTGKYLWAIFSRRPTVHANPDFQKFAGISPDQLPVLAVWVHSACPLLSGHSSGHPECGDLVWKPWKASCGWVVLTICSPQFYPGNGFKRHDACILGQQSWIPNTTESEQRAWSTFRCTGISLRPSKQPPFVFKAQFFPNILPTLCRNLLQKGILITDVSRHWAFNLLLFTTNLQVINVLISQQIHHANLSSQIQAHQKINNQGSFLLRNATNSCPPNNFQAWRWFLCSGVKVFKQNL